MPGLSVVVVEEYYVGQRVVVVDYVGQVDHGFITFVDGYGQFGGGRISGVNMGCPV